MRLRKTKLTEKICVKCRATYASFHHSTRYCQTCYELIKADENVKYQLKDLRRMERRREIYDLDKPDFENRSEKSILREVELNGSIKNDYSTYPDFLQNVKPIKKEKPRIIDVDDVEYIDKDYQELLERLKRLDSPSRWY